MSKIIFKGKVKQFDNGSYLILPATPADKRTLDTFCTTVGNRYVTVTANYSRGNKTYDQCKTIFALINILFETQKDRKPTEDEQALVYSRLLWKYADRIPDPINPEETVPITLSKMEKMQAARFINSIMGEIYENNHGLTDAQEVDLRTIFEEFQSENNTGVMNPIDYDDNGVLLSESEWRRKNNFSFASGINDGTLQLAHILSRGAHEAYRDCCWNWLMLTDYEHNQIQHSKGGWLELLRLYPHLALRVKNAYDNAHELYPHEIQVALKELNIECEQSESKEEDLVSQALEAANIDYNIPEEEGLF